MLISKANFLQLAQKCALVVPEVSRKYQQSGAFQKGKTH